MDQPQHDDRTAHFCQNRRGSASPTQSRTESQALLQERMRAAIRYTLITVLDEELEQFVNAAPYQRTVGRRDYRNGC